MRSLTADRGLCGGFNSNICKLAKANFKRFSRREKFKNYNCCSKGLDQIKREYSNYVIKNSALKKKQISFNEAEIMVKKSSIYLIKMN